MCPFAMEMTTILVHSPCRFLLCTKMATWLLPIKLLLCCDTTRKRSILTLVYTKSRYVSGNEAISSDHPFTRLQANKSAQYCVPSPSQGAHASVSISTAMAACCSICMFI